MSLVGSACLRINFIVFFNMFTFFMLFLEQWPFRLERQLVLLSLIFLGWHLVFICLDEPSVKVVGGKEKRSMTHLCRELLPILLSNQRRLMTW